MDEIAQVGLVVDDQDRLALVDPASRGQTQMESTGRVRFVERIQK
jgi:hypothetical protein